MTFLFNKYTGAIYSRNYAYYDGLSAEARGLGTMIDALRSRITRKENVSYTNIMGLSVLNDTNPPRIRHPDGTFETVSDGFTGLFINGSIIKNANVAMDNGRCLVPLRLISEKLGATVSWDSNTRKIAIQDGDRTISLETGSNILNINGKVTEMDVTPQIINDFTYVPIRFIAESMGCSVEWSQGSPEGPYYLLGIPHVMVSRYPEGYSDTESTAAQSARTALWEGIAKEYPMVSPERTRLVNAIESLEPVEGNDRFYFAQTDEKVSLWIDKYTSDILVCDTKQGQKILRYDPKGKGAVLEVFGETD
jgi:hypothetical protein